jgi:probable biosynthetic protein (TIGR04098 family)
MDTVKRYGLSMLDGTVYLIPSESRQIVSKPLTSLEEAARSGIPAVRMSNAFVMKFDGAEWLKKSRPKSGILDTVVELPSPPDSFDLCKRVQQGGSLSAPSDNFRPVQDADVIFQYAIQPDRDVNGVGLLYFANYPLFLDLAERQALKQADPPWSDSLINTRSLLVRKVVYLNNAAWNDSMEIRTRSWVRLSPESDCSALRVASEQRMYRQSDGRMMCVCWSEKIVKPTG